MTDTPVDLVALTVAVNRAATRLDAVTNNPNAVYDDVVDAEVGYAIALVAAKTGLERHREAALASLPAHLQPV